MPAGTDWIDHPLLIFMAIKSDESDESEEHLVHAVVTGYLIIGPPSWLPLYLISTMNAPDDLSWWILEARTGRGIGNPQASPQAAVDALWPFVVDCGGWWELKAHIRDLPDVESLPLSDDPDAYPTDLQDLYSLCQGD